MAGTRRGLRLPNATIFDQISEPRTRPSRTSRRQPKQEDVFMGYTKLITSIRYKELSGPRTTRSQTKRKAPEQDLVEALPLKRSTVQIHAHCTDDHCLAFSEASDKPAVKVKEVQDKNMVGFDHSPPASSPAPSIPKSGFLALPRELRDEIYKHVLISGEKRAVTLQNRTFITKSGLIGVNSQIKEEFLDATLFFAPVIHTTVRNHNFAHVVTFLNRLSEVQLNKLAAAATPNSDLDAKVRSRKIIITLTYSRTKTSTKPQLNRWLDRFDDPKRRGAEVRIEYKLDRDSWGNGGYKQRAHGRATLGPRGQEEVNKILRATREGSRGYWF